MLRLLCATLCAGLLSLGLVAASANAEDDKNKCVIAVKGDNDIVKACTAGGIKRAKAAMKAMQNLAKKGGLKHECDDCHKDEAASDWTLTKDGEEKFKKMLAVVAQAQK
jgi:hypothetical protein